MRRSAGLCLRDHAARDLSKRLVQNFHGHHDLSLATLHVHLDDDSCMEVTALKGPSGEVRHLADHIIAERGVRYGRVVMIPTASDKKPKARKARPSSRLGRSPDGAEAKFRGSLSGADATYPD